MNSIHYPRPSFLKLKPSFHYLKASNHLIHQTNLYNYSTTHHYNKDNVKDTGTAISSNGSISIHGNCSKSSSTDSCNEEISFPCLEKNKLREKTWKSLAFPKKKINVSNINTTTSKSLENNSPYSIHHQKQERQESSQLEEEEQEEEGPEPIYDKIVSGYSIFESKETLPLVYGQHLPSFQIAYETWGQLNQDKSNVILLHTGLSASSHAKSHDKNPNPGWWEKFIGDGKSIDTSKFFVICTNVIGGCYGSTGPLSFMDPSFTINSNHVETIKINKNNTHYSISNDVEYQNSRINNKDNNIASTQNNNPMNGTTTNPTTNLQRYGTRFPIISIFDIVNAQFKLLDHFGIQKLYASVGASMGGMQSLAAAALYPDRVGRVISISAAARSHPYSIAMRHTQRQVLMSDPNWKNGFYYGDVPPHVGMKLARQIATISYRSGPEWEERFGRKRADPTKRPALCPDFVIEEYLDHQGEKWCLQYDPNSFLYLSKAMDLFDMSHPIPKPGKQYNFDSSSFSLEQKHTSTFYGIHGREALVKGLSPIQMPTLVIGVQSDILFPCWQQKEISDCLKAAGNESVAYYEVDALYGHDTFLIDLVSIGGAVKGHLESL